MIEIFTSGAFVNFILVIVGGSIGMLLKKGIPERLRETLMKGMALCVLYIGVSGLFEDAINPLIVIISTAIGAVIGELIDLDKLVNQLGARVEKAVGSRGENGKIAEGFVSATLLFCVGAMTVVGAIDSGISGDNTTLYSKSVIDCISAAVFASTLGFGVVLSSVAVLIIEGVLTVAAKFIQPVLTTEVIAHMSVIGSLLIIAIAFNMMGFGKKIKVMNIIPAIFLPILLCIFM